MKKYRNSTLAFENLLNLLLGEFYDRNFSKLLERNVSIPEIPQKAIALIGGRRVGKTHVLYEEVAKLEHAGIPRSRMLYLNFEDERFPKLNAQFVGKLVDTFYALYPENHHEKVFLMFDEIQNVEEWAKVIRRLLDTKNVQLIISGSSAKLLSKEIATSLRGRSLSVEIWPFHFYEYLQKINFSAKTDTIGPAYVDAIGQALRTFLLNGGYPEVIGLEKHLARQVLQEYSETMLFRDIIERHGITNMALMRYMFKFLAGNIARPLSIHRLSNDVRSQGLRVGKNTLYEYMSHIEDAFFAFGVTLFTDSIRKKHSNPRKVYCIDNGLARAISLTFDDELGRLFENLVYVDLRRTRHVVNYYITRNGHEVDFVATPPIGAPRLIQVTLSIDDPEVALRENTGLTEACEELGLEGEVVTLQNYPKWVRKLLKIENLHK